MKTNKKFYQQLLDYEKKGLIQFMPRHIPEDHIKIYVGKKTLSLHKSIADFAKDINEKIESHDFFSENMLERYLDRSVSYVDRLVRENKYVMLIRGRGLKFLIKKDWK